MMFERIFSTTVIFMEALTTFASGVILVTVVMTSVLTPKPI